MSSYSTDWPRPLILGHRGASAYAPENTLGAFRLALDQGADGFELDVTLSADGVPVVIHDDTVDRTTDGRGAVARLTLAELRELDASLKGRFPAYGAERIPTLDEVLAELGARALINVELKQDPTGAGRLAEQVVALVRAHGLVPRVLVSSFYYDNLQHVRRLEPALPLGLLYDTSEPLRVLSALFAPGVAAQAHHPYHGLVNALTLRGYHARGWRVNVWTVDAETHLRRLLALGVDGVITNCPDVAVRVRGLARPALAA